MSPSVVIDYFEYRDTFNLCPVEPTVLLGRGRIVGGAKDHPVGMFDVNGKATRSTSRQFVASSGQVSHALERRSRMKLLKSQSDPPRPALTVRLQKPRLLGEPTLELPG